MAEGFALSQEEILCEDQNERPCNWRQSRAARNKARKNERQTTRSKTKKAVSGTKTEVEVTFCDKTEITEFDGTPERWINFSAEVPIITEKYGLGVNSKSLSASDDVKLFLMLSRAVRRNVYPTLTTNNPYNKGTIAWENLKNTYGDGNRPLQILRYSRVLHYLPPASPNPFDGALEFHKEMLRRTAEVKALNLDWWEDSLLRHLSTLIAHFPPIRDFIDYLLSEFSIRNLKSQALYEYCMGALDSKIKLLKYDEEEMKLRKLTKKTHGNLKGFNATTIKKTKTSTLEICPSCTGQHTRDKCPFKDMRCTRCNRTGHIAPICRQNKPK